MICVGYYLDYSSLLWLNEPRRYEVLRIRFSKGLIFDSAEKMGKVLLLTTCCVVFTTVCWLKMVFSDSDEKKYRCFRFVTQFFPCFPDDKVWTVVNHNSTEMVRVQGSSLQKPHVMKFNYSASLEQLRTLVGRSEQCQQEVVYLCRKSRLFNTWGGYWTTWAFCSTSETVLSKSLFLIKMSQIIG